MRQRRRIIAAALLCLVASHAAAAPRTARGETVDELDEPLYTPFLERYILDELKQIRSEMHSLRAEMVEKVVNKELEVADKSMAYASNTVTYFFYLIVGASSLLVLVGWTSIRDIKRNIKTYSDQEVARLTSKYERRLQALEDELHKKSLKISENQAEIDRTNEIHSLWLKASQETNLHNKLPIYDEILSLRPDDIEALTYKAHAVLAMNEPQWATNLCDRVLQLEPDNGQALYHRACARACLGQEEDALEDLGAAISVSPAFRDDAQAESCFESLKNNETFRALTGQAV